MMEEELDPEVLAAIEASRTEAEEAHRQHIAALNGLAGIAIIQVSIAATCAQYSC